MSSVVHKLEERTTRWTRRAAWIVTFLMLATAFAGAYGTQRLYSSEAQVAKSHRLHIGLERLLSLLRDAETGQRGYLITGRDEYLSPYTGAASAVGAQLDELAPLVENDPQQKRQLVSLQEIAAKKLSELESVIAIRRASGFGAAQTLVQTDKGRQLMQDARKVVATMNLATEAQLANRRATAKRVRDTAVYIAVFSAAIAILAFVLFATWMRRITRARSIAIDLLHDQKEFMRVTLASISDGVATTDSGGRLRTLNVVGAKLTGWDEASAVGCKVDEIFHLIDSEHPHMVDHRLHMAATTGHRLALSGLTLITKSGLRAAIDCSAAPMEDADGNRIGTIIAFRDVTIRMRHEQELRDSDRRKSEFLAVMSHELRNPLAAIQGALDVLHRIEDQSNKQAHSYALMTRQVRQMVRIIDDLLDVVRIAKGHLELQKNVIDLRVMAEQAIETVRPTLNKRQNKLVTDFLNPLPAFYGDGARLSQAVGNLLVNASKYSEAGSTIRLNIFVDAQQIVISVEDHGIGLSPDDTERIFEMFAQVGQTKDLSRDGLGVGLSLCKQIAFLHGGQISAKSAGAGRGSVFTITLPKTDTAEDLGEHLTAIPSPVHERSGMTVLVADDNEDAADALATLLRLSGYEVIIAHDGEEATRLAAKEQPNIALLDIGMPKLTGYQVAQHIRAQSWGKRSLLIAITGWGQPEDRRNSADAGFDIHFTKPVNFETLAQAMAEAI